MKGETDRNSDKTRANRQAKPVPSLTCVSSNHQDLRWFQTSILSTRSVSNKLTYLLIQSGVLLCMFIATARLQAVAVLPAIIPQGNAVHFNSTYFKNRGLGLECQRLQCCYKKTTTAKKYYSS